MRLDQREQPAISCGDLIQEQELILIQTQRLILWKGKQLMLWVVVSTRIASSLAHCQSYLVENVSSILRPHSLVLTRCIYVLVCVTLHGYLKTSPPLLSNHSIWKFDPLVYFYSLFQGMTLPLLAYGYTVQ